MKTLCILAVLPLMTIGGAASAGQAVQLSDAQMDGVTAGFFAAAQAGADALGRITATSVATLTQVSSIATTPREAGSLDLVRSVSVAASAGMALASIPVVPIPAMP